jgi:hypothetical protein
VQGYTLSCLLYSGSKECGGTLFLGALVCKYTLGGGTCLVDWIVQELDLGLHGTVCKTKAIDLSAAISSKKYWQHAPVIAVKKSLKPNDRPTPPTRRSWFIWFDPAMSNLNNLSDCYILSRRYPTWSGTPTHCSPQCAIIVLLNLLANELVLLLVVRYKQLRRWSIVGFLSVIIVDILLTVTFTVPVLVTAAVGDWVFMDEGCICFGTFSFQFLMTRWFIMAIMCVDRSVQSGSHSPTRSTAWKSCLSWHG